MKNKTICFIFALALSVSLSSCALLFSRTHKMTADLNNPTENNAELEFINDTNNGYFWIKEWNGKDISESLYGKKNTTSEDKARLTVPSGNNSFTFDVRYTFSNSYSSTTYPFEDIELQYVLEPGKKYTIKGNTKSLGLFKATELYIGIYDTTARSTLLKEWKLGETG